MGYCANKWISDYTYTQVLAYRAATPASSISAGITEQPSLLVWGRISKEGIELEPAFEVTTRPALPNTRGPYTLDGLDANGAAVFSISFAGNQVTHAPEGTSQFAFAVPVTEDQKARLVSLRLRGNGRQAVIAAAGSAESTMQSARASGVRQSPALQRIGANNLSLRWNKAAHPMVMVRDARNGQILSFARDGAVTLGVEPGRQLDLVFSDRIRSQRQRITVDR
jgi:hypothetical protein